MITSQSNKITLWQPTLAGGLLLTGGLAAASMLLARLDWFSRHGLGALTIAIVLGIAVGNTRWAWRQNHCLPGINFSKQQLLRLGIVLYGLRLTLQDVLHVGPAAIFTDALVLGSTFALTMLLGTRVFGLPARLAALIGAGSSICGAAAVMATDPVIEGRPEQVSVAVSGVVLFGSASMFLYPLLFSLAQTFFPQLSAQSFGVFAGATIHEVAQVIVAGKAVSDAAADTAVITKMVRVMMLAPFLLMLSFAYRIYQARRHSEATAAESAKAQAAAISVPWFAFLFIAVVLLNSMLNLPAAVSHSMTEADNLLLAMAMAGLGFSTRLQVLRQTGLRPFLLTAVVWLWLMLGGVLINLLVNLLLSHTL